MSLRSHPDCRATAPRALSYDLYWGTSTEWGTPINTSSTFVTIALTASLEHETLYYWRVDAKNEAGTTRGNVWSFTTVAAPATRPPPAASPPNAVWFPSPASGATNQNPDSVSLLWEPGESGGRGGARTTSYDVYYGTTQNLAADDDLDTPIRTTRLTVDVEQLAAGTTYYWRVDANNAAGATTGPVWSFTTRNAPAPAAPVVPGGGYTPPVVSPPPAETTPTISISEVMYTPGGDAQERKARTGRTVTERDDTSERDYEWETILVFLDVTSLSKTVHYKIWATPGTATECRTPPTSSNPRGTCSGKDYLIVTPRSPHSRFSYGNRYLGYTGTSFSPFWCGKRPEFLEGHRSNRVDDDDPRCVSRLSFRIISDRVKEETETFQLHVGPLSESEMAVANLWDENYNVTCAGQCTATITIRDND